MVAAPAVMTDRRDVDNDVFMDAIYALIPDAYRLAYGMVRGREEASDVVQEATLRAWRHRNSFRPGSDVRPWYLAIVANQCRQALRDRWWSVVRRADLDAAEVGAQESLVDESARLRRALRRLRHSDRLILVLRYYLDFSVKDTAATLRISPVAAKVRTHRALARLRTIMGAGDDFDDE
jgi:RNA polymerase sigma factor (sigma-70 family)